MNQRATEHGDDPLPVAAEAPAEAGEWFETVIVGGGQAGLAVGYHLAQRGRSFVILDANRRVGDAWRHRWDSLRLFTPARYDALPGMPFPAPAFSYPAKDEVAEYLDSYAARFGLPVMTGVRVDRLSSDGDRYVLAAGDRRFEADNVVVASGAYQQPRIPAFAAELDAGILQLHPNEYRNPSQLPAGDVLVVGAGNSGAEIAVEVARTHPTWLSGPDAGHIPVRTGSRWDRLVTPPFWWFASRVLTVQTVDRPQGPTQGPDHHRATGTGAAQGSGRRRSQTGAENGRAPGWPADAGRRTSHGGGDRAVVHRLPTRLRLRRPSGLRPGRRPDTPPRRCRIPARPVLPGAVVPVGVHLVAARRGRQRRCAHRRSDRLAPFRRSHTDRRPDRGAARRQTGLATSTKK